MAPSPAVRVRIKGTRLYLQGFGQPYEAGADGRRTRNWIAPRLGPNAAIAHGLAQMRARARHQVRNDPIAAAAVEALAAQIVGTGIKPKWSTSSRDLNERLADLWLRWTDEADADGQFDFYGQQQMLVRGVVTAGDAIGRLRRRQDGDMATVPLQVQLLEADYCPVERSQLEGGSRESIQGVEFDGIGRRVAYWLYRQHPADARLRFDSGEPVRVPAGEVLHVARAGRPGQVRGEPWFAAVLTTMKNLSDYQDATLLRQKVATMYALFVRQAADDPFLGERNAEQTGTQPQQEDVTVEPGTVQVLEPGEELDQAKPPDAGETYEPFTRWMLRYIAAGIGLPYEQLSGDFTTSNDRQYRAAVNEFRRRCAGWQHHLLVYQWCRPIVRRWVQAGIMSGAIEVPAGMPADELYRVEWTPEAWPYIHPVQDAQAIEKLIRIGLTSRKAEASRRGEDVEKIDAEQREDNERAEEYGVGYDSDGRRPAGGKTAEAPQDDRQDDDTGGKPPADDGEREDRPDA